DAPLLPRINPNAEWLRLQREEMMRNLYEPSETNKVKKGLQKAKKGLRKIKKSIVKAFGKFKESVKDAMQSFHKS
ncbi:hypothetical protein HMI56_001103, partial [Coelomomyces lativittatus]